MCLLCGYVLSTSERYVMIPGFPDVLILVKDKLFTLNWIPGEDQLADDCTKTQIAAKARPHIDRTLMKVPDYVKGFKSTTVGNR